MLFIIYAIPSIARNGDYFYDFNETCSRAYQDCMSMHFDDANVLLSNERKVNPGNLMYTYLSDYEDCITLLLNCDKNDYNELKNHFDQRIALLEKGDPASPWFLFCKAGIYMHWAMASLQFGDQMKAAFRFRKSFMLLRENERLFPYFEYNYVFTGLQEAVVGALPGNYQWMASVFGIKGSIKNGTQHLTSFLANHTPRQLLYEETVLYAAYVRFYLAGEQKSAWELLNKPEFNTRDNLLHTFVKLNIALDYRKADVAAEILKDAESGNNFDKYPFFYYLAGVTSLLKSDIGCIDYFQQYVRKSKNDLYIKNTWQKMAFAWYLASNMQQANYCREQAITQGSIRLDADKQARKFAESKQWPDKDLLHARLLTDGGYYQAAFAVLGAIDPSNLKNPADKTEYYYRLGRVYQELTDHSHALEYYNYAIRAGKNRHEQFAARAALQSGIVYEQTSRSVQAIASYRECLDMPSHDFQNAIDQQAKAGINRLEGAELKK